MIPKDKGPTEQPNTWQAVSTHAGLSLAHFQTDFHSHEFAAHIIFAYSV